MLGDDELPLLMLGDDVLELPLIPVVVLPVLPVAAVLPDELLPRLIR
jgi:hypothetical protein